MSKVTNVSDTRQVTVSMSAARFGLYSMYDAAVQRISDGDPGYARYMLPMLRELQTTVRRVDGDQAIPFDYTATVEGMLAGQS